MYFCYIDESGDAGFYDPEKPEKTGSPYLIYTGIIVQDIKWKETLNILKKFRREIAKAGLLSYDEEFHCAEMIDPRKNLAYTKISVSDRWKLIEDYAYTIGQVAKIKIIAVVLDKKLTALQPHEYTTSCVTKIYQAFNHFLNTEKEHGMVFFDRANERKINTHVRILVGTGVSDQKSEVEPIKWVLEDPIYKVSAESMFVQSADLTCYTFKEQEFPSTSRKKFNADLIFKRKLLSNCYVSHVSGKDGIIRT